MYICILGRQPKIGLAELESLYGSEHVRLLGSEAAQVDVPVNHSWLGGTIKVAKPLATFTTTSWPQIAGQLAKHVPQLLATLPEGKLKLGLSVYGIPVDPQQLLRTGLELKKTCRNLGRSVRLVPNKETTLNSAAILHNQLTSPLGMELLFINDGSKTHLAQTVSVQDVDDYAQRDHGRPKRDARVGMLPPKLAQVIVNLAAGSLPPSPAATILDPFCGTGVVLQEALLMGYAAYGSDLEQKMIDYSTVNVADWLPHTYPHIKTNLSLELGDATSHRWKTSKIDAVASEVYLGQALSGWPTPEKLREIIGTCNVITEKFLRNIYDQIKPGTRLCLALPAWKTPNGQFYHLSLLDRLSDLGYNRVSFSWVSGSELVYHRPDQIVARELLIITRK